MSKRRIGIYVDDELWNWYQSLPAMTRNGVIVEHLRDAAKRRQRLEDRLARIEAVLGIDNAESAEEALRRFLEGKTGSYTLKSLHAQFAEQTRQSVDADQVQALMRKLGHRQVRRGAVYVYDLGAAAQSTAVAKVESLVREKWSDGLTDSEVKSIALFVVGSDLSDAGPEQIAEAFCRKYGDRAPAYLRQYALAETAAPAVQPPPPSAAIVRKPAKLEFKYPDLIEDWLRERWSELDDRTINAMVDFCLDHSNEFENETELVEAFNSSAVTA